MNTTLPAALQIRLEWADLYQRLQAFQVHTYEDVPLAFLGKLARMNGWSAAYAQRVFREYQRYLFLTQAAGHFVCPCEAVDQTWHFHLIYTESYWQDLCGAVLGKPLHHIPSRGGLEESNAFHRSYAQTLASYQRWFGEVPPADIWETPGERLRDTPHLRLVNTRTHWLLPRPPAVWAWLRQRWLTGTGISVGLAVTDVAQASADSQSGDNVLILLLLGVGVLAAYAIVNRGKCPVCKQRKVFHSTGVRNDKHQVEHRCSACGHTAWVAVSSGSNGGGCGGGDGGFGGGDGGCGGSGGSGGG
ncbi:MAG: hypothetical protein R3E93_10265 [Thiothrix sp.]